MVTPLSAGEIASLLAPAEEPALGAEESGSAEAGRQRRAALLVPVEAAARWHLAHDEATAEAVAEALADASREPSWRLPMGDSGILDLFTGLLLDLPHLRQGLKIQVLRLVGNSCADTDANRDRLVSAAAIPAIMHLLVEDEILAFVIPVLYNVLVDHVPAQAQARDACLSMHLVNLIGSPRLVHCQAFLNYVCKILGLLVSDDEEANVALSQTPLTLLWLANRTDVSSDIEDALALTALALSYLRFPKLQSEFVSGGASGLPQLLSACHAAFMRPDLDGLLEEDPESDVAVNIVHIHKECINVLADLSDIAAFPLVHPLGSPATQTLESWLRAPLPPTLQSAACIALGNLSRSDEASVALVTVHHVHIPVIAIVSNTQTTDSQLLHSALAFLKNLAIPPPNKPLLGDAGLLGAQGLPRIWGLDTVPQIQFDAISLTRLLLVSCPANVRRVCAPLSTDPASPAHSRTNVHRLMNLFERTDADATKLEAARAVASICRVLHSTPVVKLLPDWAPSEQEEIFPAAAARRNQQSQSSLQAPSQQQSHPTAKSSSPLSQVSTPSSDGHTTGGGGRRERFYKEHALIARLLGHLFTQKRWPILRSEALFVFALMCRSRDGTQVIIGVLQSHEAINALAEAITGRNYFEENASGGSSVPSISDGTAQTDSAAHRPTSEGEGGGGRAKDTASQLTKELLTAMGSPEADDIEPKPIDPVQKKNMARVDLENGLVLVTELRKMWPDGMPIRQSYLDEMIREGSELMVQYRNEKDQDKGKGKDVA